jgi:5-formyltetrahydrofolate cyclo-ligase
MNPRAQMRHQSRHPLRHQSRHLLRQQLRVRRAALNPAQRARIAREILRFIARQPWLRAGRAVSIFVGSANEIDTRALRALARRRGCRVYLPRITDYRERRMQMAFDDGLPLRPNRYGIGEPRSSRRLPATGFAVVFVPLLGFDARRHRLGYGAGYYDRWLAGCPGSHTLKVGLAAELARVPALPALPTDIPLDLIVTDTGIH